jgi:hypothetical protein
MFYLCRTVILIEGFDIFEKDNCGLGTGFDSFITVIFFSQKHQNNLKSLTACFSIKGSRTWMVNGELLKILHNVFYRDMKNTD